MGQKFNFFEGGRKMTLALLILISMMWIPVGLFFLGFGEAKGTGFVTAVVGIIVVVGATIQCLVGGPNFTGDAWGSAPLFVFGILYLQVAHALLAGLTDLRSLGNGALVVAIVCAIYAFVFATGGGLKPDGTFIIGKVPYLCFMYTTFTVLCLSVVGQAYGKIGAKLPAWLLIILSFTCLLAPAIGLLAYGKLPF
jgi:putative amide transporter protein